MAEHAYKNALSENTVLNAGSRAFIQGGASLKTTMDIQNHLRDYPGDLPVFQGRSQKVSGRHAATNDTQFRNH